MRKLALFGIFLLLISAVVIADKVNCQPTAYYPISSEEACDEKCQEYNACQSGCFGLKEAYYYDESLEAWVCECRCYNYCDGSSDQGGGTPNLVCQEDCDTPSENPDNHKGCINRQVCCDLSEIPEFNSTWVIAIVAVVAAAAIFVIKRNK